MKQNRSSGLSTVLIMVAVACGVALLAWVAGYLPLGQVPTGALLVGFLAGAAFGLLTR